eukprot:6201193-Pleurochrysis_carterae.AAC.3
MPGARPRGGSRSVNPVPPPVDLRSLDLERWKGRDGVFRFADAKAVARRSATVDGGVDVQFRPPRRATRSTCPPLSRLTLALSDAVLPIRS